MKRIGLALCMAAFAAMGGCGEGGEPETQAASETVDAASAPDEDAAGLAAPPAAPNADADVAVAAEGAPAFAAVYPGGVVEGPPVVATAEGSDGGLVTYLTDAAPDAVIAFHKQRAEAAGLASVMAMNQGEARAYGAAKDENNLQVVASPTADGRTSVQLSWSAAS